MALHVRLTALLCLSLALCAAAAAATALPPEDMEASGDDLEMDGSGGGPMEVILDEKPTVLGKCTEDTELKNQKYRGLDTESENGPWDRESIIVQDSKSFMESKEVLAVVIGGGVGGLVLAVMLAGFLISKWQKKDSPAYSPALPTEPQYHRNERGALRGEEVVLV
ncbi:unnamed protein product [Knipowitschia caucasica]